MAAPEESEPHAMLEISSILLALPDDDARRRVLSWAADRFAVHLNTRSRPTLGPELGSVAEPPKETFADLFDAVRPTTEKEKALVAAYWKAKMEATPQFGSQELNKLLTDLGHRVLNITDALSASIQEKPALILQVRKSGTSRQARKTYKVSDAGFRWVESRLSNEAS
jgi:hypothetical protein